MRIPLILFVLCILATPFQMAQAAVSDYGRLSDYTIDPREVVLRDPTPERIERLRMAIGELSQVAGVTEPGFAVFGLAPARAATSMRESLRAFNEVEKQMVASPSLHIGGRRAFLSGDVVLRLRDGSGGEGLARLAAEHGLIVVPQRLEAWGIHVLRPSAGGDALALFEIADALRTLDDVQFAQPHVLGSLENGVLPNDAQFGNQWSLLNTGQYGGNAGADAHAVNAWDRTTGAPGVVIAVIDNGVQVTHPEFTGRVAGTYDATDQDDDQTPVGNDAHGTQVAGIALAAGNNSIGVAGMAWGARLMAVRHAGTGLPTDPLFTTDAILTAAQRGASIINCSWVLSASDATVRWAIENVMREGRGGKGCVVVCGAGNDGAGVRFPATIPGVISVGATDHQDVRWSYSNFGPELSLVAPSGGSGAPLPTTDLTGTSGSDPGDYAMVGGTSFAAPLVAGAAALALASNSGMTTAQVLSLLTATADDRGPGGRDDEYGHGRLNAQRMLEQNTGITLVAGVLSANTTWQRTQVYRVTSTVTVPSGTTLTIESGTVIKFEPGASLQIAGTFVSQGTALDPVVLTSFRDDAYGGDTNLDGASSGQLGDWYQLGIQGGGGTFSGLLIRFAGNSSILPNYEKRPAFSTGTYTGIIENLRVEYPNPYQSYFSPPAYGAIEANGACTIRGCTVTWNPPGAGGTIGIRVNTSGSPQVHSNIVTGADWGIVATGWTGGVLQGNTIEQSSYGVIAGYNTALSSVFIAGNIIRLPRDNAIAGVQVTSVSAGCTVLGNQVLGRFIYGINLYGTASTVDGNLLRDCDYGIVTNASAAILRDNQFLASTSQGFPFHFNGTPWPSFQGSHTFGTNWRPAVALSGAVDQDVTPGDFGGFGFPSLSVINTLSIGSGGKLRLSAGRIVKLWPSARITTSGGGEFLSSGTPANPVVLTSYRDDALGGDLDLSPASNGIPGDWGELQINGGASSLTGLRIRYGGNASGPIYYQRGPSLRISSWSGVVEHVVVEDSSPYQSFVSGTPEGAIVAHSSCTIRNCTVTWSSPGSYGTIGIRAVAPGGEITSNTIRGAQFGISPEGWSSGTIAANTIEQCTMGIDAPSNVPNSGIRIENNLIRGASLSNTTGISMSNAGFGNTIRGNQLLGPWQFGITLFGGASVLVENNSFESCSYGIATYGSPARVEDNTFLAGEINGYPFLLSGTPWPTFGGAHTFAASWYRMVALSGSITEDITPVNIGNLGFTGLAVPTSLTIGTGGKLRLPAGMIVKLWPQSGISTSGDGEFLSSGTPANPVVLTSYRDDSYGGDHDLGGPSVGQPGDWGTLQINGANNGIISGLLLRYGGNTGGPSYSYRSPTLSLANFTGIVEHVTVDAPSPHQSFGYNIPVGAIETSSNCTIRNCTVNWTIYPGSLVSSIRSTASGGIIQNNLVHDSYHGISIEGWSSGIVEGNTLEHCGLGISATQAAVSGVTLRNNVIRTPYDANSVGISIVSSGPGCVVTTNDLRGPFRYGVEVQGASPVTVSLNRLTDCSYGITTVASPAVLRDNVFLESMTTGFPFHLLSTPWPNFQNTGPTSFPAGWRHAISLGGSINHDVTIGDFGGFGFESHALPEGLVVGSTGVLRLPAGSVLKVWLGCGVTVNGQLISLGTAANPVVFTSYRDDAHGGDTNGDGPSSAARGDWGGITLNGGDFTLSRIHALYGGVLGAPYVYRTPILRTMNFTGKVVDCLFEPYDDGYSFTYEYGNGLQIESACEVLRNTIAYDGNPVGQVYGIRVMDGAGRVVIEDNTIANATYGIAYGAPTALASPPIRGNAIANCVYGIACFGDVGAQFLAPVVEQNEIEGCGTGIQLSLANPNANVRSNTIHDATDNAIWTLGGSGWIVENSCVQNPGHVGTGTGVRIEGGSDFHVDDNLVNGFSNNVYVASRQTLGTPAVTATGNRILNAGELGIWLDHDGASPAPGFGAVGNDLYGSGSFDFYASASSDGPTTGRSLQGNWWGTTDAQQIAIKVHDRLDDPQAVLADVSGPRSEPIQPDAPRIDVSAGHLEVRAKPGESASRVLFLRNTGTRTLSWSLEEAAGGSVALRRATMGTVPNTGGTNVPWLSESPVSGSILGGGEQSLALELDANGLAEANYAASLVITSNDPYEPLHVVSIAFLVSQATEATIAGQVSADIVERPYTNSPIQRWLPNQRVGIVRSPAQFFDGDFSEAPAGHYEFSFLVLPGDQVAAKLENDRIKIRDLDVISNPICGQDLCITAPYQAAGNSFRWPASDAANAMYLAEIFTRLYWTGKLGVTSFPTVLINVNNRTQEVKDNGGASAGGSSSQGHVNLSPGRGSYKDAVFHEFSHCMVAAQLNRLISGARKDTEARAMDEGFADYFTAAATSDPRVAEQLLGNGRNLDQGDSPKLYPGCGPYDLDGYAGAPIFAGALWDLRKAMIDRGVHPDRIDAWIYAAIADLSTSQQGEATFLGYKHKLLNRDLDGVSYDAEINAAFDRHNIKLPPDPTCISRVVVDAVERTVDAAGQHLQVGWSALANATYYRVYRRAVGSDGGGLGYGEMVGDSLLTTEFEYTSADTSEIIGFIVVPVDSLGEEGYPSIETPHVTAVWSAPLATREVLDLSVGPIPARGSISIRLAGGRGGDASLKVYDVSGRAVAEIWRGRMDADESRTFRWGGDDDGGPLPAGMYLLSARVGDQRATRRIFWIR